MRFGANALSGDVTLSVAPPDAGCGPRRRTVPCVTALDSVPLRGTDQIYTLESVIFAHCLLPRREVYTLRNLSSVTVMATIITHKDALPRIWPTSAIGDHPTRDLLGRADVRCAHAKRCRVQVGQGRQQLLLGHRGQGGSRSEKACFSVAAEWRCRLPQERRSRSARSFRAAMRLESHPQHGQAHTLFPAETPCPTRPSARRWRQR